MHGEASFLFLKTGDGQELLFPHCSFHIFTLKKTGDTVFTVYIYIPFNQWHDFGYVRSGTWLPGAKVLLTRPVVVSAEAGHLDHQILTKALWVRRG